MSSQRRNQTHRQGMVHIAIVNTVIQATLTPASEPAPGSHWFLVAWVVDPEEQ